MPKDVIAVVLPEDRDEYERRVNIKEEEISPPILEEKPGEDTDSGKSKTRKPYSEHEYGS